ncbi:MAG: metallophosphoesterase family protein [Anaerolineales bacterium]
MTEGSETQRKRRRASLLHTPRDSARSLQRTHNIRYAGDFLEARFWRWLSEYLRTVLNGRDRFLEYDLSDPRSGIYVMPDTASVALAADWGAGTISAYRVRDEILRFQPDITMHLGDVYYVGSQEEFDEYFLGDDDWPRGTLQPTEEITALPSYALNGNHEMYSGGHAYFQAIREHFGQEASFFCVENDYWRIVALDSGYSAKLIPGLELLPWWVQLQPQNIQWLRRNVLSSSDTRPIILLSHHQWLSAFEREYRKLGRDVGNDPRYLLWFWGHEHRLAGYGLYQARPDGPVIRGRCIGHGGMPIEDIHMPVRRDRNLVFYDRRVAGSVESTEVGYCGFAILEFQRESLVVSYVEETGKVLLRERWVRSPTGARGEVLDFEADLLTLVRPIDQLVA